ncbi:YcaO-like family protein [Legionella sp. W05-934-2]|uniref:YcaO-like family protein n=1 Tax=Legionella sp. W05-934-2 TaxID=1198649 RepID=UPI003462E75A
MNNHCERQMLPEMAMKIAESTILKLKLHAEFSFYGNELKTYHCKLLDTKNNTIFYGCGKGIGVQSKVSACFEAIEHYAVHSFCQYNHNQEHYYSLDNPLIVDKLKELDLLDPGIFLHKEKIPFAQCEELITGEFLFYPFYLLDPRYGKNPPSSDKFNYQPYAWNACDSGIASGTSREEASIHALNEAVERDAYSLFLIQAFLLNKKISIIDKQTVPEYLKKIIDRIEKEYAEELILVDITSDIGIPTILVTMTNQSMAIQPIGCGTSLFKGYALERALLESLQPLHLFNQHLAENQIQTLNNFAITPLLAKCAKADIAQLTPNSQIVNFNSLPSYNGDRSLKQQLNTIVQRIRDKDFAIYTKTIADIDTGFHCVKYIIPGFEQFYLVELGKYTLPNKRGMSFIKKNCNSYTDAVFSV